MVWQPLARTRARAPTGSAVSAAADSPPLTAACLLPSIRQAPKEEARYAFIVEWYDPSASLVRQYQLIYYTADGTLEMVQPRLNCLAWAAARPRPLGEPSCWRHTAPTRRSPVVLRSTT